jgi:phage prohead protease, HK97 family
MSHTTTAATAHLPFELRATAEGLLEGRCIPYGQTSMRTGHPHGERFAPGAFATSIASRAGKIRLKSLHRDPMPVGVDTRLEERPDGLYGTFRLYDTPEGRAAVERARDGVYGGLSVEFRALKTRQGPDGAREVTEAALHAVALEVDPAYDEARILALRSAATETPTWLWQNAPDPAAAPTTPDLTRYLL